MMTKDEMARLRRQMHRRIRVVLAQRRAVTTLPVSLAERRETARVRELPRQRDDSDPSSEPAPED
jgi:hypothetical protein